MTFLIIPYTSASMKPVQCSSQSAMKLDFSVFYGVSIIPHPWFVPRFSEPVLRAYGAVIYGICVSHQNDTLPSSINTHQRFPSNGTGYTWAASPHAVRTQVDDHCRKVQWHCQRCAKVTAANRQTMVFKLDNHCTRWMHWVDSNH